MEKGALENSLLLILNAKYHLILGMQLCSGSLATSKQLLAPYFSINIKNQLWQINRKSSYGRSCNKLKGIDDNKVWIEMLAVEIVRKMHFTSNG